LRSSAQVLGVGSAAVVICDLHDVLSRCVLGKVAADTVGVESVLRVDTRLFLRCAQLGDRLGHRPDTDVSHLDALVIIDFKRFVYYPRRAFDRD
jgi:hypothetical protein